LQGSDPEVHLGENSMRNSRPTERFQKSIVKAREVAVRKTE